MKGIALDKHNVGALIGSDNRIYQYNNEGLMEERGFMKWPYLHYKSPGGNFNEVPIHPDGSYGGTADSPYGKLYFPRAFPNQGPPNVARTVHDTEEYEVPGLYKQLDASWSGAFLAYVSRFYHNPFVLNENSNDNRKIVLADLSSRSDHGCHSEHVNFNLHYIDVMYFTKQGRTVYTQAGPYGIDPALVTPVHKEYSNNLDGERTMGFVLGLVARFPSAKIIIESSVYNSMEASFIDDDLLYPEQKTRVKMVDWFKEHNLRLDDRHIGHMHIALGGTNGHVVVNSAVL